VCEREVWQEGRERERGRGARKRGSERESEKKRERKFLTVCKLFHEIVVTWPNDIRAEYCCQVLCVHFVDFMLVGALAEVAQHSFEYGDVALRQESQHRLHVG